MEIELQENYTFEEYRILFHSILDQKKLNKTSERFNILREIYDIEGHFTVETLYRKLKEKKSKSLNYHL
jgi:Fur family ferric uptake transcriptional regulator